MLFDEAALGRVYTANQFAETFEGHAGLGANRTINERISVLASKGDIKFFRNPDDYGLPELTRSKYGYLCVEGMTVPNGFQAMARPQSKEPYVIGQPETLNTETGELIQFCFAIKPTHYKCPQTGALLPVENPDVWVYPEVHRYEKHPNDPSAI